MKRVLGCSVTGILLVALVSAGLLWCLRAYVRLARDEVAVEQAWSSMENAYQHRLSLADDLLGLADRSGAADPEARERLRRTIASAATYVLSPELLEQPARLETFRAAQDDLAEGIEAVEGELAARVDPGARPALDRIRAQLAATRQRLTENSASFDDAARVYNRALGGFPERWIAALVEFRTKPTLEVAGVEPGAP